MLRHPTIPLLLLASSLIACTSDEPLATCNAHAVLSVSGAVVDGDGDTLGGARVQPCIIRGDGIWLCLAPTDSTNIGEFERTFDGENACMRKLAMRVTGPREEGVTYSTAYCQAELGDNAALSLGTVHLVRLVAPTSVEERHVQFASGLALELGVEDGEPSELKSSVDGAHIGCGNVGDDALSVISLAPEGRLRGTRLTRVPLPPSVANGTQIDIFVLGGLATQRADESRVDEGELDLVGTGVAQDGALVVDLPLLYLSTLVLRVHS